MEVADDDRDDVNDPDRGRAQRSRRRAVADRQARPPGRRARRRRSPTSRSARPTAIAASASAAELAGADPSILDRRLLFVTGKGGVGKTTIAAALALLAARAGKRTLVCEVDAKGNLADFFDAAALTGSSPRGRARPARDGDEHRGVAAGVPAAVREDPAARPHRPAGPHVRLRRQRRPGREGDPHRRQAVRRCASGTTTSSSSTPWRPATSSASSAPRRRSASSCRSAWCATRPAGCSTSSSDPATTGVVDRRRRPRRCRSTRRSSWSTGSSRDGRRPRRRRRQPGAARAVRRGRGGGVRRAAHGRPASGRCSPRRPGAAVAAVLDGAQLAGHAAPHRRRAPRPAPRAGCPTASDSLVRPELFTRSHGVRASPWSPTRSPSSSADGARD